MKTKMVGWIPLHKGSKSQKPVKNMKAFFNLYEMRYLGVIEVADYKLKNNGETNMVYL